MAFEIGQVFVGGYPEEAADWCNASQIAHIEELDWESGKPEEQRRFQIVENQALPEMTDMPPSVEERLADIEDALVELAGIISGGE
jgi:hypothetical protein